MQRGSGTWCESYRALDSEMLGLTHYTILLPSERATEEPMQCRMQREQRTMPWGPEIFYVYLFAKPPATLSCCEPLQPRSLGQGRSPAAASPFCCSGDTGLASGQILMSRCTCYVLRAVASLFEALFSTVKRRLKFLYIAKAVTGGKCGWETTVIVIVSLLK